MNSWSPFARNRYLSAWLEWFGEEQRGGWAYHLPDGLGSVRQLADADGDLTLAQSYAPYVSPLASTGAGDSAYGFAGEWTDAYIKLIYLRARYLDPVVGRFLTRDPWEGDLRQPTTLQPYQYVGQNPINLIDPSGEFAIIPLLLVGAAGGALGGVGYYAIRTALNPCAKWNWGEALFWTGAGTVVGTALGGGIYGGWLLGVQAGLWAPVAGTPLLKFAIHEAHHAFPILGKSRHIQTMLWRAGIKGSDHILRIPIP